MPDTAKPAWPRPVLALVWTLSFGLYAGTSTLIFHSFILTGFDNAVIEQVVARLSHLSAPISEVEGHGINYFGDHFSPILAVYAPFYRLVPQPETLFAVQGGVLAVSVVVILVTATRHVGRRAGLVVTVMYALSFGLLNCTLMGARETPFAVLLLALAGACYLGKSVRGVVLASLGLLLVKEDLGITVAAIGFVLALESRSRRAGVALVVVGVASFLLVMTVVLPVLRNGAASPYLSSPHAMLEATASGGSLKLVTLILTFGAAGLLCLRDRWSLVTIPTFAWRFTAPNGTYWTPLWHYSAALMPIVFIATVAAFRDSPPERGRRRTLAISSAITTTTLAWAVMQAMPVFHAYGSARQDSARQALQTIPVGATVVSDQYLIGHLAGDRTAYHIVSFEGCPHAEFVVAHVGSPEPNIWGGRVPSADFEDVEQMISFADAAYGGSHEVVSVSGAYAVLRRTGSVSAAPCTPTDAGRDLASGTNLWSSP